MTQACCTYRGPPGNGELMRSGTEESLMKELFIKVWEGAREQQRTMKHPGIPALGDFTTPGLKR